MCRNFQKCSVFCGLYIKCFPPFHFFFKFLVRPCQTLCRYSTRDTGSENHHSRAWSKYFLSFFYLIFLFMNAIITSVLRNLAIKGLGLLQSQPGIRSIAKPRPIFSAYLRIVYNFFSEEFQFPPRSSLGIYFGFIREPLVLIGKGHCRFCHRIRIALFVIEWSKIPSLGSYFFFRSGCWNNEWLNPLNISFVLVLNFLPSSSIYFY